MEIKEILNKIVDMGESEWQTVGVVCTVADVDKDNYTCILQPVDGSATLEARLTATEGKQNTVVLIPKKGSYVIAVRITNNDYFVAACGETDKILIGGERYGGMVKVEELVRRLNAIENAFNGLLNEYKTHVHTVDVAHATTLVLNPLSTQNTIETTERDALENKEVLHGRAE